MLSGLGRTAQTAASPAPADPEPRIAQRKTMSMRALSALKPTAKSHLFSGASPSARLATLASVLALGCALAGCGKSGAEGGAAAGGAPGMPPPPQVGVITVTPGAVSLNADLPGRTEASRVAQVRARATGIVQKRLFIEGSDVRAGQTLFLLDPAPYAAAYESSRANQAKAEAALAQAKATLERNRPLAEARAISQQDWTSTQAAYKLAQADTAAARAAVTSASISLGYATVKAPISGRIGRSLVTEGALVSATEATQLAIVQQVDPLYVNFTQSATEVQRLRRAVEAGTLKQAGRAGGEVQIVLEDGSVYGQPGKLLFSDLTVDSTSGQVTLRAEVPNPKGDLLPGMYVKVRATQAESDQAILLPQQAVTRGVAGDTVLVVGPDQQVATRPVTIAGSQGNRWVVLSGLKPGEQVVVDGFQKIRPKTPVTPVPWPAAASSAPSAPAAASAPASR